MTRDRFTPAMDQVWAQLGNHPQDVGEQVSWNGDLGHLEGDITPVADDLRADLDQLFFQATSSEFLGQLAA